MLGIAGFGAVLCLHFPQYLTFTELRPLYSLAYLRAIKPVKHQIPDPIPGEAPPAGVAETIWADKDYGRK